MILLLSAFIGAAASAVPEAGREALRRGDCPAALAAIPHGGLENELARASCGDSSGLEAALTPGVLDPYARLVLATRVVDTDPAKASALLAGVSLPGSAGLDLRLLAGKALVLQKRSLEAREDLRKLLETSRGAEARYWLARGAVDRGELDAAVGTYRVCWSEHVSSPFAEKCAEELAKLGKPVPDTSTAEGKELALKRARALVKDQRAAEALPLLQAAGASRGEIASAAFKAKDYALYVSLTEQSPPTGAEAMFDFALGTARAGDYAKAAERYRAVIAAYPGTATADTASFKIAYMAYDAGQLEDAVRLFAEHLGRFPASKHLDESLWFTGWAQYRMGEYPAADSTLGKLVSAAPKSELTPGAHYWRARIAGLRGDPAAEKAGMESLIKQHPLSGHAWQASLRLGRTFAPKPLPAAPAIPKAFRDAHPDLAAAEALAAVGLYDWARERLKSAVQGGVSDKATALALAWFMVDVGAYRDAQALAKPWCPRVSDPAADMVAMAACLPRPERATVETTSRKYGLNALLPYAIMTQESGLDPTVTSPAGARGLMQLMPEVAAPILLELVPGWKLSPDMLYRAGLNAWLGTEELGRLLKSLGSLSGEPLPLVIAGYNGGGDAVKRWVGTGPVEPDVFAENVSYTETRRYVRRVLGHLMSYRNAYGDPPR